MFKQWLIENYGTCYRMSKSTGIKMTTVHRWYRKDEAPSEVYNGTYLGRPKYQKDLKAPQRIEALKQVNQFIKEYNNGTNNRAKN